MAGYTPQWFELAGARGRRGNLLPFPLFLGFLTGFEKILNRL
jgi:hypothetical protein